MASVYGYQNYHQHQRSASYYGGVPMVGQQVIPPPQAYHMPGNVYQPQPQYQQFPAYQAPPAPYYAPAPAPAPQVQQEQPQQEVNGGVSSVLDYDLVVMSKFLTYLALRLFARSDTDNVRFHSSIKSVLSAVRLPLSSLILASYYLLQKYEKQPESFTNTSDDFIFQTVVLSLVLANKANDDNTFTNKSWSDATGVNIRVINAMEANWLALLSWRLHDVDMDRYNELHVQFTKYTQSVADHQKKLQQQKAQQQQQEQRQQQLHVPKTPQQYYREPISPAMSDRSEFSPIHLGVGQFQPTWSYEYQSAGFEPHPHRQPRYSHQKSYSLQLEPDYCVNSGSYQKNMYCQCRYCVSPSRGVDWSYNMAAAF